MAWFGWTGQAHYPEIMGDQISLNQVHFQEEITEDSLLKI